MKKYRNKYRIPSGRAAWWDYGWNGSYYVTICTADRQHFFGNVKQGEVHLSEIGQIADSCWRDIPKHFPFVAVGEFVVMPNHVHGIIIINKPDNVQNPVVETQNFASPPGFPHASPPGFLPASLQSPSNLSSDSKSKPTSNLQLKSQLILPSRQLPSSSSNQKDNIAKNKFGPQSKNLGSIIRGYKIGVTKNAKPVNSGFEWQERFHDHIIRNENDYNRILKYIETNPQNWKDDELY